MACIKMALQHRKECPVCRMPISSARTLRSDCAALDGVSDERISEVPARLIASSEDVQLSGGWDCPRCTMHNAETGSRCVACNCRRPSEHKQSTQEAPQRYRIVPAKARGRKRKLAESEEGSPTAAEPSKAALPRPSQDHVPAPASALTLSTHSSKPLGNGRRKAAVLRPSHDRVPAPASALMPSAHPSRLLGSGGRMARTSGASGGAPPAASTTTAAVEPADAEASDDTSERRRISMAPQGNTGGDGATGTGTGAGACRGGAGAGGAGAGGAGAGKERVPLVRSIWNSKSGFKNVHFNCSERAAKRPWQAKDDWGKSLGMYAEPEEAAAAYSRWLGHGLAGDLAAAVDHEAARAVMSREAALEAARVEGLTLAPAIRAGSTPFRGVYKVGNGPRCFLARMYTNRGEGQNAEGARPTRGDNVGCFHSAEEAALALARQRARSAPD